LNSYIVSIYKQTILFLFKIIIPIHSIVCQEIFNYTSKKYKKKLNKFIEYGIINTLMDISLNQPLTKIPPHNIEAERAALGAMLLEKEAITDAVEFLKENDFYRDQHRTIFRGILELYNENEPVDLITLGNWLHAREELEKVGGILYLTELMSDVPTAAGIKHYCDIIRDRALQRVLIKTADEIINTAYSSDREIKDLLNESEAKIMAVAERTLDNFEGFVPIVDAAKREYFRIEEVLDAGGTSSGINSGFRALDNLTAGLHGSELFILAARPSMGKTALALNIARNVAMNEQKTVAFFSLEMSKSQLAMRILCSEMKINQEVMRKLNTNQSEEERNVFLRAVLNGIDKLWKTPLYVDDSPQLTVSEMRAKLRRMKSKYGLSLVVVDYLQLLTGDSRSENRTQEISGIARQLKALAREFEVPVIALSQLSRMVESRSPRRPQLSDLRESGAIEQDADVVAFLYRPAYYGIQEFEKAGYKADVAENTVELIVAKQRNGPTDTVHLQWYGEYAKFTDYK